MDRNFDDLSHRFAQTIYENPRGQFRLAALKQDFKDFILPIDPQAKILDLGAGQGQFSSWLASHGGEFVLCDHSQEMLKQAKEAFVQQKKPFKSYCCPLQDISKHEAGTFDLVLNHAVLEWLDQPFAALNLMSEKVAPNGWLSVMFYHQSGHVWRQLMNGRLHDPKGSNGYLKESSNAPKHSFESKKVINHLEQQGFKLKRMRGIRCIYDHMHEKTRQKMGLEALLAADLEYGLIDPYRQLSRYVHVLFKKS